jgi:predicted phosphoribosyltransferase
MVKRFNLSQQQINYQVSLVRAAIRQRSLLYHGKRPPPLLKGRTVLIVDDGLASGYTMMAAVESIRSRQPSEIIVAVPVASATALPKVENIANRVIACVSGFGSEFYVSDFYRYWHDPSDEEVLQCFKEWGLRHRPDINKLGKIKDNQT